MPRAFLHNLAILVGLLVAQNTLGLFIAVQLQRLARLRRLFQVLYTTPYLVSPLVVGYLWTMLLSPTFGPVNAILKSVGLGGLALPWLGDSTLALPTLILITIWRGSDSRSCCTERRWPGSNPNSSRRPPSTAPAAGDASGTSPCRCSPP